MYYNGSKAKDLYYNGVPVENAWYNGVKVWPLNETHGYRVYMEWDPATYNNICLNGMWWNGPMMTEDLIYSESVYPDASYKNSNGWQTMSWTEVDKMISTATEAVNFYCSELSFRVDSTAFNSFEFKTNPYYQPEGNVHVYVNALTDDGQVTVASKTVAIAPNTVYTIFRGDE